MNLIDKAWVIAKHFHKDQYYGENPYWVHLFAVEHNLNRFHPHGLTLDDVLLSAGILHDTIEDTSLTLSALTQMMGIKVSSLVDLVSNPKGVMTRKDKFAYSLPRIAPVRGARLIKLADRIANVESGGKVDMYIKEYPLFRKYLYPFDRSPMSPVATWDVIMEKTMWGHLDNLLKWENKE